ncbi:MAG: DUF5074 domain-containing protein [Balneolaceae bacterium]
MNPIQIHNKFTCLLATGILIMFLGLASCSDNPVSSLQEKELVSLLVANEGAFGGDSGSLSSYDPATGQTVRTKFQQANGRELAGIIQNVLLSGDRLFIVANNIDKIEVVDAHSLESLAIINFDESGLTPAGFALANENKGYVSNLFDNSVAVVDLENYTVTDTRIEVGSNPRDLVVAGNRLFVANSGFGNDNTVTVINTETDEVLTTVTVGPGPERLRMDSNQNIWVVSVGNRPWGEPENNVPGRIDVLDGSTAEHLATVETGGFPKAITVSQEAGQAWVVNTEAVQRIDMNSYELLEETFIRRSFNGIGYSEVENRLYLAHSLGYEQSGQAIIYDLEGAAIDSFQVGIAPMDFIFQVELN